MPSLVVPEAGLCVIRWLNGSQPAVNVLGLKLVGTSPVAQVTADVLSQAVATAWTSAAVSSVFDTQTTLASVSARDLRTEFMPEYVSTVALPLAGIGSGERASLATAGVVTLRTAKAGRRFRGRVYFGGIAGSNVDDETSTVDSTQYTKLVAFMNAIRTNFATALGAGEGLAVVSRPNPDAAPPWPGQANLVVSAVGRSNLQGSQRRRLIPRP